MADWSQAFDASYRFMRVSRTTGAEVERLTQLRSGGTITRNQDTQTFESAEVPLVGTLDIGSDLVRVYLDAAFRDGTRESVALGTYLANVPSRDVQGAVSESSAVLDGRLQELADDSFDAPIVVPAGSNVVDEARWIAEGAGLSVEADESDYALSTDWAFGLTSGSEEDGGSKLDAVNALLELAGFSSASTDPMGTVQMRRYVRPADRAPSWSFAEGANARFLTQASEENDRSQVANVVLAVYETPDGTVVGEAVDDDPSSPYSTVTIGRRRVAKYTYSDEVSQQDADAKAAELLRTNQSVVHKVRFSHVYQPVAVGDAVTLDYRTAGITGGFAVRTQTITMGAGCLVEAEARAFSR